MQLQPSTERRVFAALFRKPVQRINGVRLVSFDPKERKEETARGKQRAYYRIWYERNKAKVRAKANAWDEAHPEQAMARKTRWEKRNLEKVRKYKREYMRRQRLLNPGRVKAWRSGNATTV